MSDTHSSYWQEIDFAQMVADHPIGDAFPAFARKSRDEIRAHQERLFARCVARAWRVAFYKRLWSAAGLQPGECVVIDGGKLLSVGQAVTYEGDPS